MATYTYSEAVEQTITAGEQIHQIVNGTATTEVTVEDGSKVPSVRKALLDNFYFKDPIAWQAGQTENVFNQLRQFTDGSWWYAPSATASNPISMGSTPVGDPLWKIYDFDAIGKLTPQLREALRRSYAEAGYQLVAGSFEAGGAVTTATGVLLYESNGKAYSWGGALPKIVAAGSTPASSGGISPSTWTDRSVAIPPGFVNVKSFGAKGEGVTDDSTAIQQAFTFAGSLGLGVYFPAGTYVINTTCTLPTQSISVHGEWTNTIIKGAASPLIAYPAVAGKVHNISRISFEYSGIAINATKVWSSSGIEPSCIVSECRFKSLAAGSTAIKLSGIWASRIYGNSFVGSGRTAGDIAVSIVTGDNMDTSVMNTDIQNNSSVSISYPVKYNGRTISSGGRVEGLTVLGNKFVAGKTGVMLAQTLATAINGNMCSDFEYAIDLYGDFDFTISGNPDLSGSITSIRLNELAGSILERGVITGNKIPLGQATGGILLNAPSNGALRGIAICGNVIGRVHTGTKATYGIKYIGTGIANIAITGNVFMYITTAIDRNGNVGSTTINGNAYSAVDNTGVSSPHNTPFTASIIETLAGGTSHVLTVALPAGAARDRPHFASCAVASVISGSPLVCIYKYDQSTKDQVQFTIARVDGSALPSTTVRFAVAALLF